MAKKKLKKIAKDIAKQPKLKKVLATYLAEIYGLIPVDIQQSILIHGHRGYLAHSEKELTDLFDKSYEELLAKKEKAIKDRDEDKYGIYNRRHADDQVEKAEKNIERANEVYDAIFEEVFLVPSE